MADDLSSAGKLAKAWGVPPKKVKEAIEKTRVEPDVVKSGCNYYGPQTAKKIKAALES
mgnify:CR=1 FL=1